MISIPQQFPPDPQRARRARAIAADYRNGSIYLVDRASGAWLVTSQRYTDTAQYYDVSTAAPRWTCSCPDARAGHACKHQRAVALIVEAQRDVLAAAEACGVIHTEDIIDMIDELDRPGEDLTVRQTLAIWRNAISLPHVVLSMRYWSRSITPERIWTDPLADVALFGSVGDDRDRLQNLQIRQGTREDWRRPNAPPDEIARWIAEQDLQPITRLIEYRNTPYWLGQYEISWTRATA